jgi:hypothetical protein
MVPVHQRMPSFAVTVGDERERTVLKCPIPGCICWAIAYDPELKNPKLCRLCGAPICTQSAMCVPCNKHYSKLHPSKRRLYESKALPGQKYPRLPNA